MDLEQHEANEEARAPKASIVFSLQQEEQDPSVLDLEREKHRRRAEKFGTKYVEPGKARLHDRELVLASRKERFARPGFATGIDVFSQEEVDKRAARAARFNISEAQGLQYAPDEEELAKVRRAKKFGVEYEAAQGAMMDMDLFEARTEAAADVERRPDAVYLYGVDVMSTGDCLSYFGEYGPTFVEWINDSACIVTFKDRYSAARAIAGMGRPLPAEELGGQPGEGLDVADPANMPYLWHKGKDFMKQGTPVHLIYRMAVVTDKKDPTAPRKTRELWKQQAQQGGRGGRGRAGKSRRTAHDQSAGHARMDEDGDVEMADVQGEGYDMMEYDGEEGGRGQGRRRRKQRTKDGQATMILDYGADDDEGQGNGAGGTDAVASQGAEAHASNPTAADGDHPHEQQKVSLEPEALLRRILKAKRKSLSKQQAVQPAVAAPPEVVDVDADAS